nr:maleylpyruvate isomerase N-terminal domain-containing protein [uncultured Actinoplanes sp.]
MSALRDETASFAATLESLARPLWDRPTRCRPWLVRDVVGHVINVLGRVPDMVAGPAPADGERGAGEDPVAALRRETGRTVEPASPGGAKPDRLALG